MKKITTLLLRNYCKQVTIIIGCIASLNMAVAQKSDIIVQEVYYKFIVNAPEIKIPEEVTINGFVKDEAGLPLANAIIKADYGKELLTDNNGAFLFTLKKEQVTAQNIYASYGSLVTGVRSYHPSMENTTYDITLYKPTECCKKTKPCEGAAIKAFTIDFKTAGSSLTATVKKQLDAIASSLKDCPDANILLIAHIVKNKSTQTFSINQLNAVKNYLLEKNGISANRIKTNEVIDAVSNNSIDVSPE